MSHNLTLKQAITVDMFASWSGTQYLGHSADTLGTERANLLYNEGVGRHKFGNVWYIVCHKNAVNDENTYSSGRWFVSVVVVDRFGRYKNKYVQSVPAGRPELLRRVYEVIQRMGRLMMQGVSHSRAVACAWRRDRDIANGDYDWWLSDGLHDAVNLYEPQNVSKFMASEIDPLFISQAYDRYGYLPF